MPFETLGSSENIRYNISSDDICKQRHLLKPCPVEQDTISNEVGEDLTSILKNVIEKRRVDNGWHFTDETSGDEKSRASSRISANFSMC